MEILLEIENIKRLKARYFRALDTNDWGLFAATLSEDCQGGYRNGELSFDGRDAIVAFMHDNMSGDKILTMHHGHHPEIEIVDALNATGIWYLQDIVLALEAGVRIYGGGIYADEYRKIEGQWCISKIGYERTFECSEPLDARHIVTRNMFA